MKAFLIRIFGPHLGIDWKIAVMTIVSTLLIMVDYYHGLTGLEWLDRLLLYMGVPLFITIVIFRQSPAKYGFSLGDWRVGIPLTILVMGLLAPLLWFVNKHSGEMNAYYGGSFDWWLPVTTLLELAGWEYVFRGWLMFGYGEKWGANAIWLQAVPFAVAHVGKPEVETLSTIFGGFLFGWVAWRAKSFIYAVALHWYVFMFTVLITSGIFK
jgi:uncharacterized protein